MRVPAGVPLPLRLHYQGRGDDWTLSTVVVLQLGQRYVYSPEVDGPGYTLKEAVTGMPVMTLPPRWFHNAVCCPR